MTDNKHKLRNILISLIIFVMTWGAIVIERTVTVYPGKPLGYMRYALWGAGFLSIIGPILYVFNKKRLFIVVEASCLFLLLITRIII